MTERCNFRCVYCLPHGYVSEDSSEAVSPEMTVDEIRRLVMGFASLGVTKVRLTGGEPTIRRDILEIAKTVSTVPGIQKVAMTTNGNRLAELAGPLRDAGVSALNISVDSLKESNFKRITGMDRFKAVMEGVTTALSTGFETVKMNVVLMRDSNAEELSLFQSWIQDRPVSVRFIELMRTGQNSELFEKHHLSGAVIQSQLVREGWTISDRKKTDGPAIVYSHPDFRGTIGVIAPYASYFCQSCNRLRVTSRAALRLCLFGDGDSSLRPYLTNDSQTEELAKRVQTLVLGKAQSHSLLEGKYGNTQNFSSIGG